MTKRSFDLPDGMLATLADLARSERTTQSAIVRRLVAEGLERHCLTSPAPATPVPATPPAGARDRASAAPTSGPGTRPSARRWGHGACVPRVVPGGRRS